MTLLTPSFPPKWLAVLALCAGASLAMAATPADAQYSADSKAANDRYAQDKRLCNDETSSNGRLQCRRDAKAEYDAAIAAAKAQRNASVAMLKTGDAACNDCGRVTAVHVVERPGETNGVGAAGGGIVGGVLGNQVGSGNGKTLATIAGAVGGALVGRQMERKYKAYKVWNVDVQFDNGDKHTYVFNNDPRYTVGDWVRKHNNSIARN